MKLPPPDVWSFDDNYVVKRVCVFDRVDSTNSVALSFANVPAKHGLAVLAREQTAGRGQHGRTWQAPPGSSVLMSVLLFPPPALRRPAILTAWAAVGVCQTVSVVTNLEPTIKWPNDVLVGGKKVCGILIEQRTTGILESPLAAVVGIGLNVSQSNRMFEQAGLPMAASLAILSGNSLSHDDVASNLIKQLDALYQACLDGDLAAIEMPWKHRLGLVGKSVLVEAVQAQHRGRVRDLTLGGLDLEMPDGDVVRLMPEAIRHVHAVE